MNVPAVISAACASNSSIVAPRIVGIASKKLYAAAFFLSIPKYRAVEIVDPLLDIPGMIAKP